MSAAWKDFERRVCRALGGQRAGPTGMTSDCTGTPWAVEVKRSSRPGPPVLAKWVLQAKAQAHREKHPWLLVVAGHNDRRPIAVLDFWELVDLAQAAGRIPVNVVIEDQHGNRTDFDQIYMVDSDTERPG